MDTLLHDLRYALRTLLKNKGTTTAALLCVALGIGANAAIFSVVNAVLLRPLPFAESERILSVTESPRAGGGGAASLPDFVDWRAQAKTLEHLAAYDNASFSMSGGGVPERLFGTYVSPEIFQVLRATPLLGRTFTADEEQPGRSRVAVLSEALWRRRFGADPQTVGKIITMDKVPYTVVGVMPARFAFPITREPVDLWTPLVLTPDQMNQRGAHYLQAVGRLRAGSDLAAARAELATIGSRLEDRYPDSNKNWKVKARPLQEEIVGDVRPALMVLLGAVGLVLLIACANVANLMLARAAARQKEVAIRTALGASRGQLMRQFLTESMVLAVLGGGLGLVLAMWGTDLLVALGPTAIPRLSEISLDGSVVLFTAVVTLVTGVLFGLVPALQLAKPDLNGTLRDGTRGATDGGRRQRVRSTLVSAEIALSLMLLAGAGLLGASFLRLQRVDAGFNPLHVITTEITLPDSAYATEQKQMAFFDRLLENLRTIPGAEWVGASAVLPLSGSNMILTFRIVGQPPPPPGQRLSAAFSPVSADYFKAMGTPIKSGRGITEQDQASSPPVVVINEAMAKKFWPGKNAIGERIGIGFGGDSIQREIVGVVANVRGQSLATEPAPAMYTPYRQTTVPFMNVVVRSSRDLGSVASAIRREVVAIDADQSVAKIRSMGEVFSSSLAERQFSTLLLGVFAAVALLLATIGIYGLISYSVTQRTREIGVRIALGARQNDVLRMVLRQGVVLALTGIAVGLVGAVALTRALRSLLYGVTPTDPTTLAAVSALLLMVAVLASFIPARRATRVDPMVALRAE